jgi:hypothetical protein
MISLLFKILADATGFNKTLKTDMPATAKEAGKTSGKAAGSEFGKEFGSQVKGTILGAIGLGAITAAVREAVNKGAEIAKEAGKLGLTPEATQELQKASEITGLSIQDLQAGAMKAPAEFTALMEDVRRKNLTLSNNETGTLSDVKDMSSLGTGALSKLIAVVGNAVIASSGTTGTLGAISKTAAGLGAFTGNQQLLNSAMFLEGSTDRAFGRLPMMPEDTTAQIKSLGGELVRKLEVLNQTMEKKL